MSNTKKKNSVIKVAAPSILKEAEEYASTVRGKPGKKALPIGERLSKRVTLSLTPKELELFTSKAGGIPNGTFLRNYLINNTDLLK